MKGDKTHNTGMPTGKPYDQNNDKGNPITQNPITQNELGVFNANQPYPVIQETVGGFSRVDLENALTQDIATIIKTIDNEKQKDQFVYDIIRTMIIDENRDIDHFLTILKSLDGHCGNKSLIKSFSRIRTAISDYIQNLLLQPQNQSLLGKAKMHEAHLDKLVTAYYSRKEEQRTEMYRMIKNIVEQESKANTHYNADLACKLSILLTIAADVNVYQVLEIEYKRIRDQLSLALLTTVPSTSLSMSGKLVGTRSMLEKIQHNLSTIAKSIDIEHYHPELYRFITMIDLLVTDHVDPKKKLDSYGMLNFRKFHDTLYRSFHDIEIAFLDNTPMLGLPNTFPADYKSKYIHQYLKKVHTDVDMRNAYLGYILHTIFKPDNFLDETRVLNPPGMVLDGAKRIERFHTLKGIYGEPDFERSKVLAVILFIVGLMPIDTLVSQLDRNEFLTYFDLKDIQRKHLRSLVDHYGIEIIRKDPESFQYLVENCIAEIPREYKKFQDMNIDAYGNMYYRGDYYEDQYMLGGGDGFGTTTIRKIIDKDILKNLSLSGNVTRMKGNYIFNQKECIDLLRTTDTLRKSLGVVSEPTPYILLRDLYELGLHHIFDNTTTHYNHIEDIPHSFQLLSEDGELRSYKLYDADSDVPGNRLFCDGFARVEKQVPLGSPHITYTNIASSTVYDETLYGYIDSSGKEIIPCKYEKASVFSEGYAVVKKIYTFVIDTDGNNLRTILPDYRVSIEDSDIRLHYKDSQSPRYSNGYLKVCYHDSSVGNYYRYYDIHGHALKLKDPSLWITESTDFHGGLAKVRCHDGRYGLLDIYGHFYAMGKKYFGDENKKGD